MLSENQKSLVRNSFLLVVGHEEALGMAFYTRLFAVAPAVKPLFTSDQKLQSLKLIQMIAIAVNQLDALDNLIPALQSLAKRHIDYGAKPEHYAVVGEVLLDTLQDQLGDAFTPEIADAWAATYTLLSSEMIKSAYENAAD